MGTLAAHELKLLVADDDHPRYQPRRASATAPRVLLTSVFGPYAQDDEYGSRVLNPMELYHNQVTRTQGPFSLRMFHRSWGIMLIQANIEAPCTLLDFPDLDRFVEEIRDGDYDIVGITSIVANVFKVRKMCELIREHLPRATIVVGGHVANMGDLHERIDADHCARGEGVRWFRRFLGEDVDRPLRHPVALSAEGAQSAGVRATVARGDTAATLIPAVGCPLGCNFCSTSAMFGGKGKFINLFKSGDELFRVMCELEREMGVRSFFVMDENFLFQRPRALRLLELMEQHDKAWALYVFTSAKILRSYTIEQLVRLGISWVWMGIEGRESQYSKLKGVDTLDLVRELQSHGICVLGSTIIGLEDHTPENIDDAIDHAVAHDTDFHQFMLYTAIPGTPLHRELSAKGLLKSESELGYPDIHGQYTFNHRHAHISDSQATEFLVRAFDRDFEVNGPSTVRIARTRLAGLRRYRHHPDARIRRRVEWESRDLATVFSALVGAATRYYRDNPTMHRKMRGLLSELHAELGWKSRLASGLGGRWVLGKIRREEQRLSAGHALEPPTFYERNAACLDNPGAALAEAVSAAPQQEAAPASRSGGLLPRPHGPLVPAP